mgnify:CR=1 FL=1
MEKELQKQLKKIRKDLQAIKSDVSENKGSIQTIKSDVAVNKTNIQQGFEKASKERSDLKSRIDQTYRAVDDFTKIVTKLEDEFTVIKKDVNNIKEVIKEELGVDLDTGS